MRAFQSVTSHRRVFGDALVGKTFVREQRLFQRHRRIETLIDLRVDGAIPPDRAREGFDSVPGELFTAKAVGKHLNRYKAGAIINANRRSPTERIRKKFIARAGLR